MTADDQLVVTGAWWDFVDEVAIRRVGPLLRAHPAEVAPVVRRWALDADRGGAVQRSSARSAPETRPMSTCSPSASWPTSRPGLLHP